jgi:hypothetical protein
LIELSNDEALIPRAAKRHRVTASAVMREHVEAVAILPAFAPQLASLQVTAYRPNGSVEVLVWVRPTRFDWQPIHVLKTPVPLDKGTRLELVGYFDASRESEPDPVNVRAALRWSDLSKDPMCVVLVAGPEAPAAVVSTKH